MVFLENVIHDPVTYTEHAKRKTVTVMDVVYALKRRILRCAPYPPLRTVSSAAHRILRSAPYPPLRTVSSAPHRILRPAPLCIHLLV